MSCHRWIVLNTYGNCRHVCFVYMIVVWYSIYHREAGIGCSKSPTASPQMLKNRIDIIKLITTCFSENLYIPASELK